MSRGTAPVYTLKFPLEDELSGIRVLLVDDHAVLRAGLRLLIDGQVDMHVIGEAADGSEALNLSATTEPDLILLDLTMPGLGGMDAIRFLKKVSPK